MTQEGNPRVDLESVPYVINLDQVEPDQLEELSSLIQEWKTLQAHEREIAKQGIKNITILRFYGLITAASGLLFNLYVLLISPWSLISILNVLALGICSYAFYYFWNRKPEAIYGD